MWLYFYAIKTVEFILQTWKCTVQSHQASLLLFQSVHKIPVFLFHWFSFRSLISLCWSIQSTNFPHWFLWPTFLIVFFLLLSLFSVQIKSIEPKRRRNQLYRMHDEIDYFELKSTRKYHNRTEQKTSILNRWINYTTWKKSSAKISYQFYSSDVNRYFFLLLLSFIERVIDQSHESRRTGLHVHRHYWRQ